MRNVRSVLIGVGLGVGFGGVILSFGAAGRWWALVGALGFLVALVADKGEMFRD